MIGPGGGDCTSPLGDVTYRFPPGSLNTTYVARIRMPVGNEVHPAPLCTSKIDHEWVIEFLDSGNNLVTPPAFSPPATIIIRYTADDLRAAGGDPKNLRIRFYDRATGKWVELNPVSVDPANSTVSVVFTQPGICALFVNVPCSLPTTGEASDPARVLALFGALALAAGGVLLVYKRRAHA